MSPVRYEEIRPSGALNRVRGMGFKWSLNPYQGCVHGCHYCFARHYNYFQNLDPGEDFSEIIFVKVNAPEILLGEISRPSWKREEVAIGTSTDPYQPIEGKYRLTRGCLEVLCRRRNPISLVTKGTLVIRDIDLLAELSRVAGCTVCFSITTLDDTLKRRLEPGTPPPLKRLQAMERLALAGVNAGVLLAPIVPGITDSLENLTAVVRGAAEHGARFLHSQRAVPQGGHEAAFLQLPREGVSSADIAVQASVRGRLWPQGASRRVLQSQVAGLNQLYGLSRRESAPESPLVDRQLQLAL